jgi:hypothetical protein
MSRAFFTQILNENELGKYESLFESCPHALAQQSVSWSKAICPLMGDIPYFLVALSRDDERPMGGLPLYFYAASFGNILTSIPHAGPLGGVFCRRELDAEIKEQIYGTLLDAAKELALSLKCVSLTIITNPFEQDINLYEHKLSPSYVFHNFCQIMRLKTLFDPEGSLRLKKAEDNNDVRRNLKKSQKNALNVRWGSLDDFSAWYCIHRQRHLELGAIPLPEELLRGLLVRLGPEKSGLIVVEKQGEVIGGVILVWHRLVADVFIMSTAAEGLKLGANYLLTEFLLREFYERGFEFVNWQSCRRNSGVYGFKERWGSVEVPYTFLTWTFPGIETVLEKNLEAISREYLWHYVLPFEAVQKQETTGVYAKS